MKKAKLRELLTSRKVKTEDTPKAEKKEAKKSVK